MISKLSQITEEAKTLISDSEISDISIATVRITLQHACVALAELLVMHRNSAIPGNLTGELPLQQLRTPSDGTLLQTLAELMVAAENSGWKGLGRNTIWKKIDSQQPCSRLSETRPPTLESILIGFVKRRNDSVSGHGIPGDFDRECDLNVAELTIQMLGPILPRIDHATDTLIATNFDGKEHTLELLRTFNGQLTCYRKIQPIPSGRCRITVQRQNGLLDRNTESYETKDILGYDSNLIHTQYTIPDTAISNWNPLCLFPDRLTEHFTGRENEIRDILEWMEDVDSHACMLFGDGGIGKTTLIVELLHRLIEGKITCSWRPEIITFYTAKRTKWGLNGLEVINAREVGVADAAIEIVRSLDPTPLGKEWYAKDSLAICQKVGGYLNELGVKRDNHLIILDNTETMAGSEEEIKALARQIKELCRRVGRVLLTSRRREPIEANPIELDALSDEEAITFLKARAESLNREPLKQAGLSTLKKYAKKLGNKPIMLEVFTQSVSDNATSLDKGFERVLRMQQKDLGEFLFSDAWSRMSEDIRLLLLVMTKIADLHDELLLKLCCIHAKVTTIQATEALQESRGLATISRFDGRLQVSFNPEFMKFCDGRTISINGQTRPAHSSINHIKRQYEEFLKSFSANVQDRIDTAFRHVLARAAWSAFQNKRFDECELFFDEAASEDSSNGLLFDRYAYFLFRRGRLEDALDKATKATELSPNEAEVWFTKGLIEARQGLTKPSLTSLTKAEQRGKPKHLCLMQKAYAHLNDSPTNKALARACLDESESATPEEGLSYKHLAEIESVRSRMD